MASVATDIRISPLAPVLPFGATIAGLTRDNLDDPAMRRRLNDLWIEHGVLLFRDGESSQDMHLELSRCFGDLEPHPFPESRQAGAPDLVKIKFYPEDGSYYDIGGDLRGGWLPWHSDLIYTHRINHGGILRPVQLPDIGGETGFIDQIAAYERLPHSLRERIEGLHVVYHVDVDMSLQPFVDQGDARLIRMAASGTQIEKRKFTYPRVIHPMVYTQAETGRKVLNVSPAFALGIYEDGTAAGDALLREVVAVCTDPALAYVHAWQPDDMVLWDNWRTLHSARGVPIDQTRVMERTTIRGDYALGRPLGLDGPVADFDV
ncbi:TauD/TfdA family dioxygenase [Novosphingobium sp. G106]|uniref:TauD/TfdA dioxygenase family protein n=1 Tax=Novosphingobium sp. G106 TaxID=2849500 RepID=UPI001C2DCE35|nr:TauD/TfdA family dioxygenase [Novosphingobium sp. G106]MBV1689719.1 TauD/TfdA family dioxygenase [Novosphingobium sp. G106]